MSIVPHSICDMVGRCLKGDERRRWTRYVVAPLFYAGRDRSLQLHLFTSVTLSNSRDIAQYTHKLFRSIFSTAFYTLHKCFLVFFLFIYISSNVQRWKLRKYNSIIKNKFLNIFKYKISLRVFTAFYIYGI